MFGFIIHFIFLGWLRFNLWWIGWAGRHSRLKSLVSPKFRPKFLLSLHKWSPMRRMFDFPPPLEHREQNPKRSRSAMVNFSDNQVIISHAPYDYLKSVCWLTISVCLLWNLSGKEMHGLYISFEAAYIYISKVHVRWLNYL